MKTLILVITALTFHHTAHADGFLCEGASTGLQIKLYNHTSPGMGTRSPAIMTVSSPYVAYPNETIATFSDAKNTLSFLGHGVYIGKVDLRVKETSRGGENIAGTKLGQLSTIELALNFSYDSLTTAIARITNYVSGTVYYKKRNGEVIEERVTCSRYLKSERRF